MKSFRRGLKRRHQSNRKSSCSPASELCENRDLLSAVAMPYAVEPDSERPVADTPTDIEFEFPAHDDESPPELLAEPNTASNSVSDEFPSDESFLAATTDFVEFTAFVDFSAPYESGDYEFDELPPEAVYRSNDEFSSDSPITESWIETESPEGGIPTDDLIFYSMGVPDSPEVANTIQGWREQIRRQLVQRADDWFSSMYSQTSTQSGYYYGWGNEFDPFLRLAGDAYQPDSTIAFAGNGNYSETNVQVSGVDEGDLVETDGQFIYFISGNQLSIVRAGGDTETRLISQTPLDGTPVAMFLNGSRLTILSQSQLPYYSRSNLTTARMAMPYYRFEPPTVTSTVYDISDPAAPTVVVQSLIDGAFVDSRQIGSDLIVVVRNDGVAVDMPSLGWSVTETRTVTNEDGDTWQEQDIVYESRDEYLARIDSLIATLFPPSVYQQSGDGESDRQSLRWLTDDFSQIPVSGSGQSMVSVIRIDTAGDGSQTPDAASIVTSGWNTTIYVTENSIYLAISETITMMDEIAGDSPTDAIGAAVEFSEFDELIEPTGPEAGPGPDDSMFWTNLVQVYRSFEITTIHRIDLTTEDLSVVAIGTITGSVQDQHSVDEYNGTLRIAAMQRSSDGGLSTAIYVLQEIDGILVTIGQLDGLAPGETLFSAHFDGDRAWIVTFEQIDPLFAIDLSDPANPVVMAELKIPGFSDYMQRMDQNHIIAIGRNADPETGRVLELQVSVFDVTDLSAPQLLHRYSFDVSGYQWSEASYDHHAFLWIPEESLLAIPLSYMRSETDPSGFAQFLSADALAVLSVSVEDGITLMGMIDQNGDVSRSLRVGEFLYSLSDHSIVVVRIDSPDDILAEVSFNTGAGRPDQSELLLKRRDLYRSLAGDIPLADAEDIDKWLVEDGPPESDDDVPPTWGPGAPEDSGEFSDDQFATLFPMPVPVPGFSPVSDTDFGIQIRTLIGSNSDFVADPGPVGAASGRAEIAGAGDRIRPIPSNTDVRTLWQPMAAASFQSLRALFPQSLNDLRSIRPSATNDRERINRLAPPKAAEPASEDSLSDRESPTPSLSSSLKSSLPESGLLSPLQPVIEGETPKSESKVQPPRNESSAALPGEATPPGDESQKSADGNPARATDVSMTAPGPQAERTSAAFRARTKFSAGRQSSADEHAAAEIDAVMTQLAESGVSG